MRRWALASIRVRLTAWYVAALFLMMVVYAAATYIAVRHEFYEQMDDELHEDFEVASEHLTALPDGRVALDEEDHRDGDDDADRGLDVWSMRGDAIIRAASAIVLPPVTAQVSGLRYASIVADGHRWRTLTGAASAGPTAVLLRVSRSEERLRNQLWEVFTVLAFGLPVVVALAGVGGYVLARRALLPIDRLASDAHRITAERLHERLSVVNPNDEIGRLAAVINDTFARLESSFEQLRRFTADASHELRTPLSVIRGIGELGLGTTRTPAEYKDAMSSMLEEVDRLTTLVDTLLRLSHGDAGTVRLSHEPVDLGHLASEVSGSLSIVAEEHHQRVVVDARPGVVVSVDRLVLREAVANLVDNAMKYGPPGSTIHVRVRAERQQAIVEVEDEGPGIPPEYRDRIFDRFFRIDEARSREDGGTGLGLAIARWAVSVNGGRIVVDTGARGGALFRIVLPIDVIPTRDVHITEPREGHV